MKITCYFIAPSGTALGDDSTTIYEVVPAGSTRKTRNVPLGYANSQTVRYKCDVTDFQYEFSKTR